MSERTLSILAGIAGGIDKAVTNLVNISQAKEKLRREDEEFQLNKKVKDAQLKKLEFETSPEAMQREREEFKQATQLHDMNMKVKKSQVGNAELNEQKKKMELEKSIDIYRAGELNTLQSEGYTEPEARNIMAGAGTTASVGGQRVGVASPEFVEQYSEYDRGDARDPFLAQLSRQAQDKTGKTATEAKKLHYKEKTSTTKLSDEEFLASLSDGDSEEISSEPSPYEEYPNAFLEDGVWKVMQNGKKYRIEE